MISYDTTVPCHTSFSMNIIIAGDYSPRSYLQETLDTKAYEGIFGSVRPIVEGADYSIVNFESTIADHSSLKIQKCGPHLKTNENAVTAIKFAGFKCVTLANNHFRDYGDSGVQKTLEELKKRGLDYVGGGTNLSEASKTLFKDISGRTLAVINACEHEFSIADSAHGGSNPLDIIEQYYAICEARKKADYVIVIIHGGHEHFNLPSIRMKKTYRFFIDVGADAVVNHHQHCWSGYEVYKGKPIFYGLGNFCFPNLTEGDNASFWNYGYMVRLIVDVGNVNFETIPYVQCFNEAGVKLLDERDSFDTQITALNSIIGNDVELKQRLKTFYSGNARRNRYLWEPYRSKLGKALYYLHLLPNYMTRRGNKLTMFFNLLNCESHRDKMMFQLKDYMEE